MKLLKDFGRLFLIITEEERYIKSENIRTVLCVSLKGDNHADKAFNEAKKRFYTAEYKEIKAVDRKDAIKKLRKFKEDSVSAIIILSLDPFVILFIYLWFRCYVLLYNRYNQWFSIRRKTLYEFISGRKGADKGDLDWKIHPYRLKLADIIVSVCLLPVLVIKNILRAIILMGYLLINITFIFLRKYYYKILRS